MPLVRRAPAAALHAFGADMLACSERDRILPVVPMFHVNAWGLPHVCVAVGADLLMPGPDLSAAGLLRLMEGERATVAAGVPTIWMGLLDAIDDGANGITECLAVGKRLVHVVRAPFDRPIVQFEGLAACACSIDVEPYAGRVGAQQPPAYKHLAFRLANGHDASAKRFRLAIGGRRAGIWHETKRRGDRDSH